MSSYMGSTMPKAWDSTEEKSPDCCEEGEYVISWAFASVAYPPFVIAIGLLPGLHRCGSEVCCGIQERRAVTGGLVKWNARLQCSAAAE